MSKREYNITNAADAASDKPEFEEKLIQLKRVAKVVKGGRSFSFAALVVIGDRNGRVGLGYGKAKEVPDAIRKATDQAKKEMVTVRLKGETIPHEITVKFGGSRILMRPASKGTGIIAGGPVRAVLESAGVQNILAKSLGSSNSTNMAKAALKGLMTVYTVESIAAKRGKTREDIYGTAAAVTA